MSRIVTLSLSAVAVAVLSTAIWPSSVEAREFTRAGSDVAVDEPAPVEDDTCDEYYACIDACAEDYATSSDFCLETYPKAGAEQDACMALADKLHEECLDECPERPDGC